MPDEDSLRHKYDPLPDVPRYRKKAKKRHVRSDHKHEYERVCVDSHSHTYTRKGRLPLYYIAMRCKACGRVADFSSLRESSELPKGMRVFEVRDFLELISLKAIPDEMEVRKSD